MIADQVPEEKAAADGFSMLPHWLARRLGGMDLKIVLALMAYPSATRDRVIWAGNERLGQFVGLKPRALQIRLKALEAQGFIRRTTASVGEAGATHRRIELRFLDPDAAQAIKDTPEPARVPRGRKASTTPRAKPDAAQAQAKGRGKATPPSKAERERIILEWVKIERELMNDILHEAGLIPTKELLAGLADGKYPVTKETLDKAAQAIGGWLGDDGLNTIARRLAETLRAEVGSDDDSDGMMPVTAALDVTLKLWKWGKVTRPGPYFCKRLEGTTAKLKPKPKPKPQAKPPAMFEPLARPVVSPDKRFREGDRVKNADYGDGNVVLICGTNDCRASIRFDRNPREMKTFVNDMSRGALVLISRQDAPGDERPPGGG